MGYWQNEKIEKQAAEIERLRAENEKLRAALADEQATSIRVGDERAKALLKVDELRAALKPFASVEPDEFEYAPSLFKNDHLRAAAAALKETGDE